MAGQPQVHITPETGSQDMWMGKSEGRMQEARVPDKGTRVRLAEGAGEERVQERCLGWFHPFAGMWNCTDPSLIH